MRSSRDEFEEFSDKVGQIWLERELEVSSEGLQPSDAVKSKKQHLSFADEIKMIDRELKEMSGFANIENVDQESLDNDDEVVPRVKFLLKKRQYLAAMQVSSEMVIPKVESEEEAHPKERKGFLKALFDIGKKFIDILDDLWAMMRSVFPKELIELVSPILIGGTGFIIHLGEGYEGGKEAYHAYQNEKIGQRKTRILTSVLSFMLAGAGVGMSIALLASAAGAAVATAPLLPILIPGALTAIYGLSLWRQSYIFHRAKEEEDKARVAYNEGLREAQPALHELNDRIDHLKMKKETMKDSVKTILAKVENKEILSATESNDYASYLYQMKICSKEQDQIYHECAILQGSIRGLEQIYSENREKRLQAERDVAFTTIEVAASTLVLVGLILGTAAVVGASLGTFGIAPLALLITGVIAGAASKIFENKDEKNHHAYTRGIRDMITNTWGEMVDYLFSPKKSPTVQAEHNPVAMPIPAKEKSIIKPSELVTEKPALPSSDMTVHHHPAPATHVSVTSFKEPSVHQKQIHVEDDEKPILRQNTRGGG